jgi:TonB family protein
MQDREWVRNRWRRFIRGDTVPDARVLLFSVIAHCLALVVVTWLLVSQRVGPVIVFPEKQQLARWSPRAVYLPPNARSPRLAIAQKNTTLRARKARPVQPESTAEGLTGERLRMRARLETKALIQDFKFRTVYGFSPFPYEFAFQISGQIPTISAADVPPRFEQYVTVEVTIDAQGRVADARVVAGAVDRKIEQTLLSAIREFKYRPASREGIPVPSQCDIVIHIPT